MTSYPQYDPTFKSGRSDGDPRASARAPRVSSTKKQRVALGLTAVGILLVAIVPISLSSTPPQTPTPPPAVHSQTTQKPDAYTAFRAKYGPWQIVTNDTVSAHIAILKQNGTREDGTQVTIEGTWQMAVMTDFRATKQSGSTIQVETWHGDVYTLSAGQTFIIEGRPETLYGITDSLRFIQKQS